MNGDLRGDPAIAQLLEDLREWLRPILAREANRAVRRHQLGGNKATYGYDLWQLVWTEIKSASAFTEMFPFRVMGKGAIQHVSTGLYFYYYRVGDSEHDDAESARPRVGHAAVEDAEAKLYGSPLFGDDRPDPHAVTLVLGLFANDEDGLGAVCLYSVGAVSRERIAAWEFVQIVWRRGDDDLGELGSGFVPHVPPPEPAPGPIRLPRKRKVKERDNE